MSFIIFSSQNKFKTEKRELTDWYIGQRFDSDKGSSLLALQHNKDDAGIKEEA